MRNLFSHHQPPFPLAAGLLALLFAFPFITPPAALVAQNPISPALAQLFHSVNDYRCDSSKWNRNIVNYSWQFWQATRLNAIDLSTTYLADKDFDLYGDCQIWVDPKLMESANATAQKFANGTYNYSLQNPHNQMDGDKLRGPTMRAFKDNWEPRILYKIQYPFPIPIIIQELLFQGPPNVDPNQVLEAWKNSSSGNHTMLSLRTGCIGLGMAQNGTHSYWVLLIEAQFQQFQEPLPSDFGQLISEGTLYRMLPGINDTRRREIEEDFRLEGLDLWEFIPGAIANLRSRM